MGVFSEIRLENTRRKTAPARDAQPPKEHSQTDFFGHFKFFGKRTFSALTQESFVDLLVKLLFCSRISMDRILASEAGDLGSNPGGSAIDEKLQFVRANPQFDI